MTEPPELLLPLIDIVTAEPSNVVTLTNPQTLAEVQEDESPSQPPGSPLNPFIPTVQVPVPLALVQFFV